MKKYFVITLASVAALSLAVSCSKEKDVLAPEVTPQPEKITISASFPEEGLTKVGFVEDGYNNKLNLIWQAGDQITITDEANPSNTQTFDIVSGMGTKSATFTGTAPAAAASYKITYNGNPANYAEQTQAADGDTGHLKYVATITGVTDYSSFTFPAAGSSAVLRLRTSIPDSFFGNVKAVAIKAGAASVKVNITNSADAGETHVFTVYASLPGEMAIPAGTELFVSFQMDDTKEYLKHTAYRELAAMTLAAGKVNTINLNCLSIETSAGAADNGTAANPYLIADQYQMDAMHSVMADNAKKYFKMVEDVDMTDVAWTPLNASGSFTKGVDFDGADHTISHFKCTNKTYASFFGVLNGAFYNVTFDHAEISTTEKNAGVVAGYLGNTGVIGVCHDITVANSTLDSTTDYFGGIVGRVANPGADIDNCKIINSTITGKGKYTGAIIGAMMSDAYDVTNCSADSDVTVKASGVQHVGGLIGRITEACTVEKCSFSGSVTGGHDVGGIVGSTAAAEVVIRNCYSSGTVQGGSAYQRCGGIVGELSANASVINCYSTASVSTSRVCGGIVGRACNGNWNITSDSNNTISKCIAFNSSVSALATGTYGSSGAIVGYTSFKNILADCYRLYNMAYTNSNNETEYINTMVDQPNCDGTNWVQGTTPGTKATYQCPYYGVAAANDATVSSLAQTLGWDPAIWDFSTDYPTLK